MTDLAQVLLGLKSCLESSEFERRVAEMEAAVAQREAQPFKPKIAA